MGQQQLLLLVLSTVIVGLAVVVGIEAFSQNRTQANLDALVNQGVAFASDVQAWHMKPAAFGGPTTDDTGTEEAWTAVEWHDLGVNASGKYTTENGVFSFGSPSSGSGVAITGCNDELDNQVVVTVRGESEDAIETDVNANYTSAC